MEAPTPLSGLRRLIYQGMGLFFVGLGALGAVLPVLPTTPFLLLATYFFARSSPRLHRWLLRSPWFGPLLRDWQQHRAIRRTTKWTALAMIVLVVGATAVFVTTKLWLRGVLLGLALIGITVVLRLPVLRRTSIAGLGQVVEERPLDQPSPAEVGSR